MAQEKANDNAVVFHSYPKLLFCWPLIVLGFLFYFIAPPLETTLDVEPAAPQAVSEEAGPAAEGAAAEEPASRVQTSGWLEILGWIYLVVAVVVLLTLGIDLERNTVVFWLVAFLAFFFLGMWLEDAQGFTFFGDVFAWFNDRNIQYDRGFGLALSVLLVIPYAVMLIWARLQHKWRITHNEFEHYSWGRADDSLARGAKRVRSTYPDLLELLLCGAGTLIVYSATGRHELRRIHHVPMLPFLRKKVDRILEMTAVTTTRDAAVQAEVEEEEVEETRSHEGGEEVLGSEKL